MHGLVSYRRFGKVRSLSSDRAVYVLGRYVATESCAYSVTTYQAWLELGRFVATEPCACSIATQRPSLACAWSDRHT
ncbi:hypothetical protein F2Q69_00023046 [Brassica cretica]|uniref:Uncharacterized protein n=1 Tax=Brassica cretica TaxID=69181 RepID=A0A8S9QBF7_BRACR|nr:hypothetical protein F2Q69_00023046 [Brassica cretica]